MHSSWFQSSRHCLENFPYSFLKLHSKIYIYGFLGSSAVKNPLAMQEMQVQSQGQEDHLEKEVATHSSVLTWEISWTEEPGRHSPWVCQRVRPNLGVNSNSKSISHSSLDSTTYTPVQHTHTQSLPEMTDAKDPPLLQISKFSLFSGASVDLHVLG